MELFGGTPQKRISQARLLLALGLTIAAASLGYLVYSVLQSTSQGQVVPVAREQTVTGGYSSSNAPAVSAIAQRYMHALLTHDYQLMWQSLHPQVRALWPGEEAFATFWQKRFAEYRLQGFTLGRVRTSPYWVNPETMVQYNQVEEVPVSLQLEPRQVTPQLPPEDLHPSQVFQNLPFVVQQVADANGKTKQWFVLAGGPADPEAPILPPLTPVYKTAHVPILMYHHISNVPTHNILDLSLTVTPTVFGQQLDYLKARGYSSITFNQLFNALYYDAPLPARPIILTFDDGYQDGYQFAYPLLKARGFSGMFYIITGKVDWQGQMIWSQLREMLAHGMQMGSHTIHHVDMGQVLLNSQVQAQQEAQISQLTLQRELSIPIQQFCYPSGEPFRHGSPALRQQVVTLLTASGYVGATTDPGMTGVIQTSQAPLALLRVRVDGRESLLGFEQSIP